MHRPCPKGLIVSAFPPSPRSWAGCRARGWLARLGYAAGRRHLADLAYNRLAAPPGFPAVSWSRGGRAAPGGTAPLRFWRISPSSTIRRDRHQPSSMESGDGQPLQGGCRHRPPFAECVTVTPIRRAMDRDSGRHPVRLRKVDLAAALNLPKAATADATSDRAAAGRLRSSQPRKKPCTQARQDAGSTESLSISRSTSRTLPTDLNQPWNRPRLPRQICDTRGAPA